MAYKYAQPMPRSNGKYPVALMAGAPADRAREIRDKLAKERGILVRYHLDYEKGMGIDRLPDDVDFVLIIKSQLGHSAEAQVRNAIIRSQRERKIVIPFIRTQHKWTRLDGILRVRFSDYGKKALPLEVTSTAYFQKVKEETAHEPEPPKTIRTPEVVKVPDREIAEILRDANAAADRAAWAGFDTVTLVRELQARMISLGATSLLVTPTSIEFGTTQAPPRTLAEIPARPAATNGAVNGAANGAAH